MSAGARSKRRTLGYEPFVSGETKLVINDTGQQPWQKADEKRREAKLKEPDLGWNARREDREQRNAEVSP